jgi:hypothetical protein
VPQSDRDSIHGHSNISYEGSLRTAPLDRALSLALIGSASSESADESDEVAGRGAFDKGDLKEATGGATY